MKNRWIRTLVLICISMLSFCVTSKSYAIDDIKNRYVFIAYSYDDLFAMLPIVEQLQKEGEIPQVLTLGPSAQLAKKMALDNKYYIHTTEYVGSDWEVDDSLKPSYVAALQATFPKAKYVVSGCAATIQGQLLKAFSKNSTTFAYWHNLNTQGFLPQEEADELTTIGNEDPTFNVAKEVQENAKYLLTSSGDVAKSTIFATRAPSTIIPVGNPLFDVWNKQITKIDRTKLQKEFLLSPVVKTILLVASSSDRAFDSFIESLHHLSTYAKTTPCNILVYPSTANDTAVNTKIEQIRDAVHRSTIPSIQLLEGDKKLSALDAAAVCDVVIDYNSPFAIFATSIGKRTLHVMASTDPYTNVLIINGISTKISSYEQLTVALRTDGSSKNFFEALSIPKASTHLFIDTLKKAS